jgi:hypothetical protein
VTPTKSVLTRELKARVISARRLAKNQTRQRLVSQKTTTKTSLSLAETAVLLSAIIATR